MNTLQLASWNLKVACSRSTCAYDVCVEALWKFCDVDVLVVSEFDAFLLQHTYTTVDDSLVELKVWNAIAEETASCFVLLKHCDSVALEVQLVGGNKSCRSCSDDSHLFSVALRLCYAHKILLESHLGDGCLILTVCCRFVDGEVQHASLLAECWTDATSELREVVGGVEQAIGEFVVALIERVVPLWWFVAQWASPVAEWHTAIHTAACLRAAVLTVESLFDFSKVVYSIMYWPVSRLLAWSGQKCFRISHKSKFYAKILILKYLSFASC